MDSIPDDVLAKLKTFNESLTEFEDGFDEFLKVSYANPKRPALEKARHDLTSLFALNSLYWTFQACSGKQPKDQEDLSIELKRVKEYMGRLKKFDDLHLRPTVNARGAKAFVRNALFDVHADGLSPLQNRAAASRRPKRLHTADDDDGTAENEEWDNKPSVADPTAESSTKQPPVAKKKSEKNEKKTKKRKK